MKKLLSLIVLFSLFMSSDTLSANSLNSEDYERLSNMGFTYEDIQDLTEEDLEYFSDIDAELVSESESYHQLISDKNGEIVEVVELDKKTFDKKVELKKELDELSKIDDLQPFSTKSAWSNTKESSFITLRTLVNKINSTDYQFRIHWDWKSVPRNRFWDAVGITHSSDWNILGSFNSRNSVDRVRKSNNSLIRTSHAYYSNPSTTSLFGLGLKFPVTNGVIYDQSTDALKNIRGYMVYRARKGNSSLTNSSIQGHYAHFYIGTTFSISIGTGNAFGVSLSGFHQKANTSITNFPVR